MRVARDLFRRLQQIETSIAALGDRDQARTSRPALGRDDRDR
jgi:hypothetical protein